MGKKWKSYQPLTTAGLLKASKELCEQGKEVTVLSLCTLGNFNPESVYLLFRKMPSLRVRTKVIIKSSRRRKCPSTKVDLSKYPVLAWLEECIQRNIRLS